MIWTECVPITWDLNLWDSQRLTMFFRPSRIGFLRLMSQKVMQVSSDGPNVNLAFLIDLGTCGLHVVHGSMKAGAKASEWELQKLLKSMWQFIHDALAR